MSPDWPPLVSLTSRKLSWPSKSSSTSLIMFFRLRWVCGAPSFSIISFSSMRSIKPSLLESYLRRESPAFSLLIAHGEFSVMGGTVRGVGRYYAKKRLSFDFGCFCCIFSKGENPDFISICEHRLFPWAQAYNASCFWSGQWLAKIHVPVCMRWFNTLASIVLNVRPSQGSKSYSPFLSSNLLTPGTGCSMHSLCDSFIVLYHKCIWRAIALCRGASRPAPFAIRAATFERSTRGEIAAETDVIRLRRCKVATSGAYAHRGPGCLKACEVCGIDIPQTPMIWQSFGVLSV